VRGGVRWSECLGKLHPTSYELPDASENYCPPREIPNLMTIQTTQTFRNKLKLPNSCGEGEFGYKQNHPEGAQDNQKIGNGEDDFSGHLYLPPNEVFLSQKKGYRFIFLRAYKILLIFFLSAAFSFSW
jgi:hypothetical protein